MLRACRTIVVLLAAALFAGGTAMRAQTTPPKPKPKAAKPAAAAVPKHTILKASEMQWGPAPDSLPAGAQMSVLDGDPSKAGPFVIRAKLPDGYKVPPHWHTSDEHVTVMSGTFLIGIGDTWDDKTITTLDAGGYAKLPKNHHHYAGAKGETILQIHAVGPFGITYLNPNDDPRKKTAQ
jgi:mannose-6-phosphate isomerase-like protein (cupin superfamily)